MTKFDCFKGRCKNCGEEKTLFAVHCDEEGYCEDCLKNKNKK